MQSFNQICDISRHAFLEWCKDSSGQDKLQVASKVTANFLLQPYLIGKVGRACWGLLSDAHQLRALESLAGLSEELGFAELIEDFAEAAIKESTVSTIGELEASLGSLVEAEIIAAQKPAGFIDVVCEQSFLNNIKQLQASNAFYKNTPLQKKAIDYFNQHFYQKELLEFCAGVEKTHAIMMVGHAGKEVKMLCNPRHMMTYQLDFRNSSALKQVEGYLGGGHVGLYFDELVKNGFLTIIPEELLVGGCRALKIGHIFGNNIAKKTLWPSHWIAEQIMEAIKEAFSNQVYVNFEVMLDKSLIGVVVRKTKDNILLEMHIKEFANGGLRLKTAYPYHKEFSSINL